MQKRVIIADDHSSIRRGYRSFLDKRGLHVVAEASDIDEAVEAVGQNPCDLLITDFVMPGRGYPDGFEYLSRVRNTRPGLPIVVVTMVSRRACLQRIYAGGGIAIVHKSESIDCVYVAAHMVLTNRAYLSPTLRPAVSGDVHSNAPRRDDDLDLLTSRERCVLEQLGDGLSVSAAARALGRSVTTVSSQKRTLMAKLKLRDDQEILQYVSDRRRWKATRM